MAKRYEARITRDIVRRITLGPLMVRGEEVAPGRVHELPSKAGDSSVFKTMKARAAYIAAINAEHPGAAEAI